MILSMKSIVVCNQFIQWYIILIRIDGMDDDLQQICLVIISDCVFGYHHADDQFRNKKIVTWISKCKNWLWWFV